MDLKFEDLPQAVSQLIEQNKLLLKAIHENDFSEKPAEEVLTLSRICELLELKRQTIYSYVSRGLIPYHKKAGKFFLDRRSKNGSNQVIRVKKWKGLAFILEESSKTENSKRFNGLLSLYLLIFR
ncbi:helix-turn-helix transcriptional regulator [Echinicola rosea]|uniref:Helix-turn-helix domain-containing protein n=1 Tax=Echinicola rosea TaxID=1807691 RepID=A0ABQ1UQF0_9BACT|nr:hypothetical protein GCM10011339_08070 [Echinicola rosea]